MRALTVTPGRTGSARVGEVPEPAVETGSLLVQTLAIGVCGTDREIVSGRYGWSPPGREELILGHESIGRVVEAPRDCGFAPGDFVVGIVRRPDPVPCASCAIGRWDMCRNGRYTERGIKERDGYGSERFRLEPAFAVKVSKTLGGLGVMIEPASVVAKAWEQTDRIGARSPGWAPRTVVVTGAGPIGLLAALLGRQRGLEVHVFDRVADGPKPELVRAIGAAYHSDLALIEHLRPDVAIECTGADEVVIGVVKGAGPSSVVCLTGVPPEGHTTNLDLGRLTRQLVLENRVIFGSVNASRTHYEIAADALAAADREWLGQLVTRRVAVDDWTQALTLGPRDVKVIVEFEAVS
jgi:threonine dehydrogenase-like Zn-dependent dehydrogenase